MGYLFRGMYNEADEAYKRAHSHFKDSNDHRSKLNVLGNLAEVALHRGDIIEGEKRTSAYTDSAEEQGEEFFLLKFHCKSLRSFIHMIRGEMNETRPILVSLVSEIDKLSQNMWVHSLFLQGVGGVYWYIGDLDKAEELLQRGISIADKIKSPWLMTAHYQLSRILLEQGFQEAAAEEVEMLASIAKNTQLPIISLSYQLAAGWLGLSRYDLASALTHGNKAMGLVGQTPIAFRIHTLVLLTQTHSQLYLLSKDHKHVERITALLDEMREMSQEQNLYGLYTEMLILQGLLKRVTFDLDGAIDVLKIAKVQAEERGNNPLVEKAEKELKQIQEQREMLQNMRASSPETYTDSQIQELLQYLQDAKSLLRRT